MLVLLLGVWLVVEVVVYLAVAYHYFGKPVLVSAALVAVTAAVAIFFHDLHVRAEYLP